MLLTAQLAALVAPLAFGGPGCLSAVSLDPAAGQGETVVFEAVYGHCEGATAFRVLQLWVGDEVAPSVPRVNLGYEGGMFFIEGGGSCAPLSNVVLHSEEGGLDCTMSSVMLAGDEATVRWAIEFDATAFAGSHGVFFDAKGGTGDPEPRLEWTQMGTFDVQPGAAESGGDTTTASTSGPTTTDIGTSAATTSEPGTGTGAATGGSGDSGGGIPGGGGVGRGGATTGCGCRSDPDAVSWLALFVVVGLRRARARARAPVDRAPQRTRSASAPSSR